MSFLKLQEVATLEESERPVSAKWASAGNINRTYSILQEKLTGAMSTARYESQPVESQKLARKMPLDGVLWFQVPHFHDSIKHFVFSRNWFVFHKGIVRCEKEFCQ
jgi:hypothetical protein